jgi:transposase
MKPEVRTDSGEDPESEWVARCLEALGHEVVVADPNVAPMYATRTRKVKTDRRDARALQEAWLLGADRPAHRLSDAQRHGRGRLAVRDALVRPRTGSIALTRAWLRRHGWRVPTGSGETFSRRVMARSLPGRLLSEVAPVLAVMRTVHQPRAYSDGVIEAVTRPDARVQRLRTVPSVGPVTAAAFVATSDAAGRFHRAHEVEAYLGLVPRKLSSGESQRRGRITKAGNRRMRWLLVQAAVSIRRLRDPRTAALRRWATGIAARRGKKIAVVALARHWAGLLYAMLRDGTTYPPRGVRATRLRRPLPAKGRSGANANMAVTRVRLRTLSNPPRSAVRGSAIPLPQVRRVGERVCRLGRSASAVA